MHLSHYLLKILSGLKAFVVNMDAVMNLEDCHDLSKSIDEIDEIVEMLGCFLGKNNSEEIFLCVNQAQVFTLEGIFGVRLNVLKMGLTSSLDLNFMRDSEEKEKSKYTDAEILFSICSKLKKLKELIRLKVLTRRRDHRCRFPGS